MAIAVLLVADRPSPLRRFGRMGGARMVGGEVALGLRLKERDVLTGCRTKLVRKLPAS